MTQVIVDEALLREPNLWVPGKKPIGSVKIDTSHSLSRGILHCNLTGYGGNDIVSTSSWTYGNASLRVDDGNLGATNSGGGSALTLPEKIPSGDKTLVFHVTSYVNATTVMFNSDSAGTAYWIGTSSIYKWSIGGAIQTPDNAQTGSPQVIVVTKKGTTHSLYVDGTFSNSGTNTLAEGSNQQTCLLSFGSSTNYQFQGTLYSYMAFDYAMNASQVQSISSNPYQFLIPA